MIVICEQCGKKYRIDPSKINSDKARFDCKDCGHMLLVTKPEASATVAAEEISATVEPAKEQTLEAPPPKVRCNGSTPSRR